MKITLDGVEALVAIADAGSFGGAAARLNKVQSAVSYNIRQLESSLDLQLFDRTGHRAVLTPAGVAVVDEGRFLLARARRLEGLAAQFADGWEARLQVVVDGALPTPQILQALRTLGDQGTPTHIQLRTEYLGGVPQRFNGMNADLMLTLVPPDDPLVERLDLPEVEFVLVASPAHPASAVDGLDLAALQVHLELSVHDSDETTSRVDTNLIPGARVFYVGDFAAKKEGLLQGLGFGWMPLHAVLHELSAGSLVELPYVSGSRLRFPLALAWRRDRPLGRAGRTLRDLLHQRLSG